MSRDDLVMDGAEVALFCGKDARTLIVQGRFAVFCPFLICRYCLCTEKVDGANLGIWLTEDYQVL